MAEKQSSRYPVGISTGFWRVARDPALLGLATKIAGLGATAGVQFVQIDLESIAEFREPEVVKNAKKMMSKLGVTKVGLHGEIGEMMAVDSAEKRVWDQTHDRLVQAIAYASKMGFFYVNIHFSFNAILSLSRGGESQRLMGHLYPVVGPDGKPLKDLLKGDDELIQDAVASRVDERIMSKSASGQKEMIKIHEEVDREIAAAIKEITKRRIEEEKERRRSAGMSDIVPEADQITIENRVAAEVRRDYGGEFERRFRRALPRIWTSLKDEEIESYLLDDGEFGAYAIVAKYMYKKGDNLWSTIGGGEDPDKLYFRDEQAFCAAVASKYIEGHVNAKNNVNKKYMGGMSIKEFCEANKIYLLFENPEANPGVEGANRLFDPRHTYYTIKNIKSPYIQMCVDFEHMVSQALDPDDVFPKLPNDFGKIVKLWHIGQAVPYGGTAHIPIARGSIAQEQIYRWMYEIKHKGCDNAYMLFERGSGRGGGRGTNQNYEVFEDSVLSLKQISGYLEKDIHPNHLPPEFYGISSANKDVWARQVTTIREHAFDPTEGLLSVPEEKHTFLGRNAVDKGKAQEWEKRKYR